MKKGSAIYSFSATQQGNPFSVVDIETGKMHTPELDGEFFADTEGSERTFSREGDIVLDGDRMIHLSRYKTTFSIFEVDDEAGVMSLTSHLFGKEQKLEMAQTEGPDGSTSFHLDTRNLLLAQAFALQPESHNMFVVFDDRREKQEYDNKSLYPFSIADGQLLADQKHSFSFAIHQLSSNSSTLFAYSKEKGKVFLIE